MEDVLFGQDRLPTAWRADDQVDCIRRQPAMEDGIQPRLAAGEARDHVTLVRLAESARALVPSRSRTVEIS